LLAGEAHLLEAAVEAQRRGLVDVEKVPSEKGPPRKVYSLNGSGADYLAEFWSTWEFLSQHIGKLRAAQSDATHESEK